MKSALVQMNSTVGALESNAVCILEYACQAAEKGARLIVFPELALSGYPPEDLILKDHFCADCENQIKWIKKKLPPLAAVVIGLPVSRNGSQFNAAMVLQGGKIVGEYRKMLLPNYGVFDEKRIFEAGTKPLILDLGGQKTALHICEDSWHVNGAAVASLEGKGIDLLINLSASPYHRGKLYSNRINALARTTRKLQAPLFYCNMVGGQDELVFDGSSMVFNRDGFCIARAKQFREDVLYFGGSAPFRREASLTDLEEVYKALKLGLNDYVEKTGFKRVVVALSGGIDSALVLAVAVDALGIDRVSAITMPSKYSSAGTFDDACKMARLSGIEFQVVPIQELCETFEHTLAKFISNGKEHGLMEENLQARIRGVLIMAFSNKYDWLVLTTGNKSEMAMGYCTLYGDMCGGYAVIKDVPKTLVFDLCRWRNKQGEKPVIPPSILARPPSAELRPNQQDTDSLPPYEILDPILEDYIENDMGIARLLQKGYEEKIVRRVVHAVEQSEYKRRQSPPGIKITPKSFGRDRRLPIVNRYRS